MGLCLSKEKERQYDTRRNKQSAHNSGSSSRDLLDAKRHMRTTSVMDTKSGHGYFKVTPSSLKVPPGIAPKTDNSVQTETETSTAWVTDVKEPELFHFAFGPSLKGESHTDRVKVVPEPIQVAPDILRKSLDLLAAPEMSSCATGRRTSSKCSRISAVSQQSCDTISVKSSCSSIASNGNTAPASETSLQTESTLVTEQATSDSDAVADKMTIVFDKTSEQKSTVQVSSVKVTIADGQSGVVACGDSSSVTHTNTTVTTTSSVDAPVNTTATSSTSSTAVDAPAEKPDYSSILRVKTKKHVNIVLETNNNKNNARNLALHEIAMRSPSFTAAGVATRLSAALTSAADANDRLSAVSMPTRDSMFADVPLVKDYNKSKLTVHQASGEPASSPSSSPGSSAASRDVLQWKRGNCLGRGSFGTVYLGLTDTGELIAVKQMEVNLVSEKELEAEYSKIYREVEILKQLRHVNIVHYLGSSFENHTISIFTQYVSGGSLMNLIHQFGPLGERIAAKYTKQLLSAVCYMHEKKVVHRDIKSGNIMMTPDGVLKLIDFGCARKLALRVSMSGSHMMRSWKGTPYWMAPEVIHESGHGKKSDIWSLGCTVYEMLTGIPPWGDREPIAAIYAIGCDDVAMPTLDDRFSDTAREFVSKCLIRDKFRRPAAAALQLHNFVYSPGIDRQLSEACSEDSKWVETL